MNFNDKTKEELIVELQQLKEEFISLKASYETDIAMCRQNEINLQISEAQKNAILNGISANIAFVDKDLKIIWANTTAASSVNKEPEEMIGHHCHRFWADPSKPCENCPSLKAFETKKPESSIQKTIDGRIWEERGEPVFDNSGTLIGVVEIATDITQRMKAEMALQESEKKYYSLYANMIDGAAMHTLVLNDQGQAVDYIINEINPAYEVLFGISKEAIVNKTSREVYGVEVPPYLDIYSKVALTGKPEIFETFYTPLNRYLSISVYCPAHGSFATIIENITERKKAEIEKEKTQKLLEDSQKLGKIGGWEVDLNTMELHWTSEMYNIHEVESGFEPELDKRIGFYTAESLIVIDKAVQRLIEYGESYDFDLEIVTAKGNHRLVRTIGKIDQENRRIFGFFQDISERKKVEEELRKANAYLENLINYANAPIIVWDPQFRISRFNHAFELITGRTEAEVLGHSLDILFPPEHAERSMDLIHKTLLGERWETVEIDILHLNGSVQTLLWNSATLFNSDGKTAVATIAQGQDITRRKQVIHELNNKNEELQKLNAQKDKFFSIIAHDLKGPFNNILGLSEILCEQMHKSDFNDVEKISRLILDSSQKTMNLLTNLLEWSSTQSGRMEYNPVFIQIVTLINDCVELFAETAKQRSIALNTNIPCNALVYVDESMISTVLRNLISNALKFTQSGGKIIVSAIVSNAELIVSVKDSGIGIDKENIRKLFRIEENYTTPGIHNEKGTGLGLILCREFIEKHGGKVWVESEKGLGSKFIFSIPINNTL